MALLWTDKYKPEKVNEIVAQHKAIGEVLKYLESWKRGKALFLYGPPGVGKTLIIETIAKERNGFLMRLNASDSRSAENIKSSLTVISRQKPLFYKKSIILVDEVDGLSGHQDRGAIKSLIEIIKNSKCPMVLIANDPWSTKLKSLRNYCTMIKFFKIPTPSVQKRLREILYKEGIKADDSVLKSLSRWSQGDLRSAILDIQIVSEGKDRIKESDLEALGYREREIDIFNLLNIIFNSRSISSARKAIDSCDKDPDEIFWWIENNIVHQYKSPTKIAEAFDLLSEADIFRRWVSKQQNWRFKGYMIDLLSGISSIEKDNHAFVQYKPPKKIIMMGATKEMRTDLKEIYKKLSAYLHVSAKVIKEEYVPYLKFFAKVSDRSGLEIEKSEIKMLNRE